MSGCGGHDEGNEMTGCCGAKGGNYSDLSSGRTCSSRFGTKNKGRARNALPDGYERGRLERKESRNYGAGRGGERKRDREDTQTDESGDRESKSKREKTRARL